MSTVSGTPITEQVCTNWETRIVGFREPTDNEWQAIESFSNNIPSVVGALPDGQRDDSGVLVLPQIPANQGPPVEDPAPIPVPSAILIFTIGVLCFLFVMSRKWTSYGYYGDSNRK